MATPRGDYAATVEAVARAVEDLESSLGATASVGVGIPGTLSPATGVVKNANSVWLNGRALDRDLACAPPPARAAGQRRELLRAVGGDGRRRPRRRASCSA